MTASLMRLLAGFIAGCLAVLICHQGMYWLLKTSGAVPLAGVPWNMNPAKDAYKEAFGVPTLFNQMFWGGLWGVLYAGISDWLPVRRNWLKGFLFGSLGTLLLGSWIAVSLIKGRPLFNGFLVDLKAIKLASGFLLNGVAFGIGLGLIYGFMSGLLGHRRVPRSVK